MECRKIIHVDMDAFYASVEQRENPSLKGKPVIVGGDPMSRGVVSACSYEARKFGIHSAMASKTAVRLCPHAVFLYPNFDLYKMVSDEIREIFFSYTDLVEPLSLDEAYLDVTENRPMIPSATIIATDIRKEIRGKTFLTASAGVSYNKFLAKIASDFNKPDGLMVITPDDAERFIEKLPIGKFHGIGKATEKRMAEMGIKTGGDLRNIELETLTRVFGRVGEYFYYISRGIDERPVEPFRVRKSIGQERTFSKDITDRGEMLSFLQKLSRSLEELLRKNETAGRTVTLKVKFFDFEQVTRSVTLPEPVDSAADIMEQASLLLNNTRAGEKKVRLLGISVSNLTLHETEEKNQLELPFG